MSPSGAPDAGEHELAVLRGLALLEHEHRVLALSALAAWQEIGIASPELFPALAALQRPSWGTLNGLVLALRKAHRGVL